MIITYLNLDGATVIAVRSSRGIVSVSTDLESETNGGKLFRKPYISLDAYQLL